MIVVHIKSWLEEDGKMIAGNMFELEMTDEKNMKQLHRHFHHLSESLIKKTAMTFLNGWLMGADGELECIYCKKKTEGFDFGKARHRSVMPGFNPFEDSCSCRLPL